MIHFSRQLVCAQVRLPEHAQARTRLSWTSSSIHIRHSASSTDWLPPSLPEILQASSTSVAQASRLALLVLALPLAAGEHVVGVAVVIVAVAEGGTDTDVLVRVL